MHLLGDCVTNGQPMFRERKKEMAWSFLSLGVKVDINALNIVQFLTVREILSLIPVGDERKPSRRVSSGPDHLSISSAGIVHNTLRPGNGKDWFHHRACGDHSTNM